MEETKKGDAAQVFEKMAESLRSAAEAVLGVKEAKKRFRTPEVIRKIGFKEKRKSEGRAQ